ncbi:receptor-like protein EIX2 [Capsicum annuum]|uniref:receptor-like protein EIX2 n=1 Tax=Capsicum annuum TaxID=4072 RepID=UPI001FB129C9|nr:receptor-like protein EIX2 [Capsicum annuum]
MKLENLQFISLSRNKLSGPIPENLEGLKKMTKTQNQTTILGYYYSLKFTGAQLEIVTKGQTRFLVSVYSYNTGFDVSSNALTGKIPEKIGLLNGIPFLNLSHNNLTGLIPKTIGEMISLESLDLSYNQLTGEIPVTLATLDFLAYLNLSYNNLSGRIPTNPHFDTLHPDGTAYIGNRYLCGSPDGLNCRISGVFMLLYLIDDNWRNRMKLTPGNVFFTNNLVQGVQVEQKVFLIFATLFYPFLLIGGCHEGERAALMSFKSLLTDPSNRLSSWKGENCCDWKGIKCSSSGHVVVVNLRNPHPNEVMINVNKEVVSDSNESDFALKGTISPLLFTLDHIQYLDLSFNNFMFSKLPVEISNLTKLTYLNLSNSMFQDSITTQFSNLTSLRSLDLSCANLVPDLSSITISLTLPPKLDSGSLLSFISYGYLSSTNLRWLEGLRRLRYLVLTGVNLSKCSESFHWAKPISSLSNLMSLQLSNCNISGRILTAQLLNLTSLSTLEMRTF